MKAHAGDVQCICHCTFLCFADCSVDWWAFFKRILWTAMKGNVNLLIRRHNIAYFVHLEEGMAMNRLKAMNGWTESDDSIYCK